MQQLLRIGPKEGKPYITSSKRVDRTPLWVLWTSVSTPTNIWVSRPQGKQEEELSPS